MEVAGTPAEALTKMDERQFDLVLSDALFGSSDAGRNVLAYARVKSYRPATALITSSEPAMPKRTVRSSHHVSVYLENLPLLLEKVADLIGLRAIRRYRPLRQAV